MTLQHWTALFIAVGLWVPSAIAQNSAAPPPSSASTFGDTPSTGAASSFGTPSGPSGGPPVPGTAPGSGAGSIFGTPPPETPRSTTGGGLTEPAPATER